MTTYAAKATATVTANGEQVYKTNSSAHLRMIDLSIWTMQQPYDCKSHSMYQLWSLCTGTLLTKQKHHVVGQLFWSGLLPRSISTPTSQMAQWFWVQSRIAYFLIKGPHSASFQFNPKTSHLQSIRKETRRDETRLDKTRLSSSSWAISWDNDQFTAHGLFCHLIHTPCNITVL